MDTASKLGPHTQTGVESEELVLKPIVVAFSPVIARAYDSRGCPG